MNGRTECANRVRMRLGLGPIELPAMMPREGRPMGRRPKLIRRRSTGRVYASAADAAEELGLDVRYVRNRASSDWEWV